MPELTQQQWMEKLFRSEMSAIAFPYMDGPTVLANRLAAAYPSSPQGLAVKQMVEALDLLAVEWDAKCPEQHAYYLEGFRHAARVGREAQDAARKAGLVP